MDRPWLRATQKLQFKDPTKYLFRLREIEIQLAKSETPTRIKSLRTNRLKVAREQRQAAIFCHGMSMKIGQTVYFASHEDQDFDFVASWVVDDKQHFAAVQLKEVVPQTLNPQACIESILIGLEKYTDSSSLTVAVHLNQGGRFDPKLLRLQHLKVASLWVFAAAAPDQSLWNLWGNFTEDDPYGIQFAYPTEA
ncbi:MAG: hypothetical protein ABIR35_09645 [Polaromonas sp.]